MSDEAAANERVVRALVAAFERQDRSAIEAVLAPQCVWTVPGQGGLAGRYEGRPAVLGLFGTLRRTFTGPAAFDVLDIATSATRVVAFQVVSVTVADRPHRFKECLVYRLADGLVVEVEEFQADQARFDACFSTAVVAAARAAR
jgi:ketosteroid isomerase-like protein